MVSPARAGLNRPSPGGSMRPISIPRKRGADQVLRMIARWTPVSGPMVWDGALISTRAADIFNAAMSCPAVNRPS